jgi:hypothetical protein
MEFLRYSDMTDDQLEEYLYFSAKMIRLCIIVIKEHHCDDCVLDAQNDLRTYKVRFDLVSVEIFSRTNWKQLEDALHESGIDFINLVNRP